MSVLYSATLYKIYQLSFGWSFTFFVGLILLSLFYHKSFKENYRSLLIFFIGCFIFEILISYSNLVLKLKNNVFFAHFYLVFGALMVGYFYMSIVKNAIVKNVIRIGVALIIIGTIILFTYQQGYLERPKLTILYNILFCVVSMYVHRQLLRNPKISKLREVPLFWFNIAFLTYTSYSIIFSIVNPIVVQTSDDLAFILGSIKNLIEPVYLVLLGVGVYKMPNTHTIP